MTYLRNHLGQPAENKMNWNLTYYNENQNRYCLQPHVFIDEVIQAIDELSPSYIPQTISRIARVTSQGDAAHISDWEAIRRFEGYENANRTYRRKPLSRGDIELVQELGKREVVYLPKSFGGYLARVRRKAGLSQKAATKLIGLPHSSLARYEADEAFPTITVFTRFAPFAAKAGLSFKEIKREYIAAKLGPEEGTLADIVKRERWFAQMSVKGLAEASNVHASIIRQIEKGRTVDFGVGLTITLMKIAKPLLSARIMILAKEMAATWEK